MRDLRYHSDLEAVRSIMERSSRFLSLSGLAGVSVGFIALISSVIAYLTIQRFDTYAQALEESFLTLVLLAMVTLILSIMSAAYFTTRRARQLQMPVWDFQTRRLLINLAIPLIAGALCCLIFMGKGLYVYIAPMTLIFYGLSLIHASKYTLNDIRGLGLLEVAFGLFTLQFPGTGLYTWALGFGVLHIIYGLYMHKKYEA